MTATIRITRPVAKLESSVVLNWTDHKGCDRDCEVETEYTFDGQDDLNITGSRVIGETRGLGDWEFEELLFDAVMEVAPDAYADWCADQLDGGELAA